MGDFFLYAPVVFKQLFTTLGNPDACDPLVKLPLIVDAKISNVFGGFDLNLWVFDGKAEFCGRFVFLLPSSSIINL